MGMAAPTDTAELVRTLPDDGNRYETVHGELLVTPAPRRPALDPNEQAEVPNCRREDIACRVCGFC